MNINIENHYFVLTIRIVHKRLTCTMSPLSSFFSSFQSPVLRVVHAVSSSFCPIFFHSLSWKEVTLAFLLKQQNFFSRNLFVLCALQIFSNGRGLGLIYCADATLMSYWHLVRKTIKHPIGPVAMINLIHKSYADNFSTYLICKRVISTSPESPRDPDSCVLILIILVIRVVWRFKRGVEISY